MSQKRIVVTGLGVVSCFGNDVDKFYDKLLAGESGVKKIDHFSTDELSTKIAASVGTVDSTGYLDKKQARRVDPCIAYGMVAGKRCIEHAGLADQLEGLDKTRCGILIGSGMGGMSTYTLGVDVLRNKGINRMSPFFIPYVLTNMPGGLLAIDLGFMGPNYAVSSACATGNHSIISAANHIRNGEADLMLCGGVEAAVNVVGLGGFCACKAVSQRNDEPERASRPWDKGRDGFVMGEGAGVLCLESLDHALARGATIYAEYLGGGVSCDAFHMTQLRPDGQGVANCLRQALKNSKIQASDVNLINAHATSTPMGDMAEVGALLQVFENPKDIMLQATKSITGHCLGAAGGVEAVGMVQGIYKKRLHPTINLEDPEDGIEFTVPTEAIDFDVTAAVSNSFGFGGHNAVLVLGPYKE